MDRHLERGGRLEDGRFPPIIWLMVDQWYPWPVDSAVKLIEVEPSAHYHYDFSTTHIDPSKPPHRQFFIEDDLEARRAKCGRCRAIAYDP